MGGGWAAPHGILGRSMAVLSLPEASSVSVRLTGWGPLIHSHQCTQCVLGVIILWGGTLGWDGWMASLTQWTWVWVSSGSWWWTGRPGVLQFVGLQRVGHDWATGLNWTVGWSGRQWELKTDFPAAFSFHTWAPRFMQPDQMNFSNSLLLIQAGLEQLSWTKLYKPILISHQLSEKQIIFCSSEPMSTIKIPKLWKWDVRNMKSPLKHI